MGLSEHPKQQINRKSATDQCRSKIA